MKKILHVITDLEQGGAEGVLYRLIAADSYNEHVVVSLMSIGYYGPKIESLGIKLYTIEFKRGSFNLKGLKKLINIIKIENPNVVQTWLYHADFFWKYCSQN